MNKTKRLLITIMSFGLATAMSFIVSFFLTPFITNRLGVEAYGFVTLAKNFTSYAVIISMALNSYATRYIALEYHHNNMKKANMYVSSAFFGDIMLASIIMVVAIGFVGIMEKVLNISDDLVVSVKILFLLVFVNFFITTISTAFTSAAYIKNRLDLVSFFRFVAYVFEVIAYLIIFNIFEPSVWYVGAVMILVTIITFSANCVMFNKLTPELKISHKTLSLKAVTTLVGNGIWNSVNSLGITLNSGLDLIICNLMLSNLEMGQLAITKTIETIFSSFNAMLSQPFQPMFLKSYSENNKEQLLKELKMAMKFSGFFSNLMFAGFFALGSLFYKLWIPSQDFELLYSLTLLSILTYIIEGAVHPLYYIYTLMVKNKIPCFITLIGGVMNVIGMIILIKFTPLGIYSIVLTTTVINIFVNLVTNPLYMSHCLKLKWYEFYPNIILNTLGCVVMTVAFYGLSTVVKPHGWIMFILTAGVMSMLGLLIQIIIVFSKEERQKLIYFVKKCYLVKKR